MTRKKQGINHNFMPYTRTLEEFLRGLSVACLLVMCISLTPARANTGDQFKMNINISGTVVANGACTFNKSGDLAVDFGQIIVQESPGGTYLLEGNYEKILASQINCTGDTVGLLQLRFTSATGAYGTLDGKKVMGVDKGPVGIELLVNDSVQNMDEWWSIDQDNPPVLKARLVKLTDDKITSGDTFSASGTLTMAFN